MHFSTTDLMIGFQTAVLFVEALNFVMAAGPLYFPSALITPDCFMTHLAQQHHFADLLSIFKHSVLQVSSRVLLNAHFGFETQQVLALTPFGYVVKLHPGTLCPNFKNSQKNR